MTFNAEVLKVIQVFPASLKYAPARFSNILMYPDLLCEHLQLILVSCSLYLCLLCLSVQAGNTPGLIDQAALVAVLGGVLACPLFGQAPVSATVLPLPRVCLMQHLFQF